MLETKKTIIYAETKALKRANDYFKTRWGQEWCIETIDDIYFILSEPGLNLHQDHKDNLRDYMQTMVYEKHDSFMRENLDKGTLQ